MVNDLALAAALAPLLLIAYAYAAYPLLLWVVAGLRPRRPAPARRAEQWPLVSITVPAFNAEGSLRSTLECLLALDYPASRREILVVSDASTDGTDAIAQEYAGRGVELLRMPHRGGKTAAENAAARRVRGDIVVNVDASVIVPPESLMRLVRAFDDPTVGVASGRDVSVGDVNAATGVGESGYVDYEMWIRALETRVGSIVGASGCFYGIRRALLDEPLPDRLSWDFASVLVAREHGYRSVSIDSAVCLVPRTRGLRTELRRKTRTMARGLQTLWYKRGLLAPWRYGTFAFMLASHKLCRWMPYVALPGALLGLGVLGVESRIALTLLGAAGTGAALGVLALRWPARRRPPALVALAGYAVTILAAGVGAWIEALSGPGTATWDPTPRPTAHVR
jgi:cellulose synthase/poly-beta-1,6-N-acetylglucosamine synthase-like glycosyltransferase